MPNRRSIRMDYDAGRQVLAGALYVKWARLLDNGATGEEAAHLFDRARALYPDLPSIILETYLNP